MLFLSEERCERTLFFFEFGHDLDQQSGRRFFPSSATISINKVGGDSP